MKNQTLLEEISRLKGLEATVETATNQSKQLEVTVAELRQSIKEKEAAAGASGSEIEGLQKESESLKANIKAGEEKIRAMEEKLNQVEAVV